MGYKHRKECIFCNVSAAHPSPYTRSRVKWFLDELQTRKIERTY